MLIFKNSVRRGVLMFLASVMAAVFMVVVFEALTASGGDDTKDDKGYIFYEAKFRKEPMTDRMVDEEIEQVRAAGFPCYRYGFLSGGGFRCEERPELILIDLKSLYA